MGINEYLGETTETFLGSQSPSQHTPVDSGSCLTDSENKKAWTREAEF